MKEVKSLLRTIRKIWSGVQWLCTVNTTGNKTTVIQQ